MKYFWIVFLFCASTGLRAQTKGPLNTSEKPALRFNPFGLVDVMDGNLSGGVEIPFNARWSLTTDLSFIFYSAYIPNNRRTLGYIIRPAIRYYLTDEHKFFLEVSFFYKRAGYKIKDWLGKDCVSGVPAYEELETFIFRKRVFGINPQAGFQKNLTRSKRLRMELYAGLGVRFKWQDIKDYSRACYQANTLYDRDLNQSQYVSVSVPHGLRLVYMIQ